ncbi:MAG: MBL fold metallo-hydrolase [Crocinitomicaceae bacterium]|nr:MBL fold metallo-hydrolase [Crocinitomicaceae bacterium]
MELYTIHNGNFKLDGGAMFGVVPKKLWERTNPADSNNLCPWAMRSLLIENGDKLILIDCGLGDKQNEKFFSHYHPHGDDALEKSLKTAGFSKNDITDVFLTHLHFDHVGGAVEWNENRDGYRPAFKNATFWSNRRHWNWATEPNARERASFLSENIIPLEESGQLKFIDAAEDAKRIETGLGFDAFVVNGHTDAQMCPIIEYKDETLVFMADLLPSIGHIPIPYVMGYDTRPILTLDERKRIFTEAADKGYHLFLEHDAANEVCTLQHTEKGPRLDKVILLKDM